MRLRSQYQRIPIQRGRRHEPVGQFIFGQHLEFVVRRDDPDFRLAVNRSLVKLYKSGAVDPIFLRWLSALGSPGPLLHSMFYLNSLPD